MSDALEDSNTRLINVFEMVMARLDTLGGQMTEVQEQLERQQAGQRHADTLRPIGVPFSGMAMLGDNVKITSHVNFDEIGRFDVGGPFTSVLVIETNHAFTLVCERFLKVEDGWAAEWESAAREKWGGPKYDEVMPILDAYWKLHDRRHTRGPLCSDVGMTSSHTYVQDEIFEIRTRIKHPQILALGVRGFIVETSDMKVLHHIAASISRACGCKLTTIDIHYCCIRFESLAKGCLYNVKGGGRTEWVALDAHERKQLSDGKVSYFTKERLHRSVGLRV